MIMEFVVLATSVLRLLLVSAVYLLNIRGLLRLTWQPRSCIHGLTTGAVLLVGVLYLSSWAPYIAYTLANGHWLLLGAKRHCLLQHFVAAEIGAVLLALLEVSRMYRCLIQVYRRPPSSAKAASIVVCLAWLIPQLLYDTVSTTRDETSRSPDSYRFLDDLLVVPQGANATHGYRVGFMICMQLLSGPVLSYYVWQYLVLFLPLSTVILYCAARLLVAAHLRRRSPPPDNTIRTRLGGFFTWSRHAVCHYGCKSNTFVDMALYYNFIWLVILRPLAILHALYMQTGDFSNAFYMDFGSHLVLAFSAVFSPFSVPNPSTTTAVAESQVLTETINTVILNRKEELEGPPPFHEVYPAVCMIPDQPQLKTEKSESKTQTEVASGIAVELKEVERNGGESVC